MKCSIFILCICFAVNVSAQKSCEWQTRDLRNYEKCVDKLREGYNSTKSEQIYITLQENYENL